MGQRHRPSPGVRALQTADDDVQLSHLKGGHELRLGAGQPADLRVDLAGEPLDQVDLDACRHLALQAGPRLARVHARADRAAGRPLQRALGVARQRAAREHQRRQCQSADARHSTFRKGRHARRVVCPLPPPVTPAWRSHSEGRNFGQISRYDEPWWRAN
jgi:hypothetical protein